MRISDKRKQELYNAISKRVMDVRIDLNLNPELKDGDKLDRMLCKLETEIWDDVKIAMNIKSL